MGSHATARRRTPASPRPEGASRQAVGGRGSFRIEVSAPGRMGVVDALEGLAVGIARDAGLGLEECHFVGVALREAVLNAIIHGHGRDPRLRLRVGYRLRRPRGLVMTVRDGGPGFDPARVPDPRAAKNLEKGHGRGLFFMRQLVDRVSVSRPRSGGCMVVLEKRLPAPWARHARRDGRSRGRRKGRSERR